MNAAPPRVVTIGHSNHALERFLSLLSKHRVEVLVDVRSSPYSRYAPHFNADALRSALEQTATRYLFMGRELGGRPEEDEFYDRDGHVLYGRLAASPHFIEGIERLERGIDQFRVALMCGEDDPRGCHRRLLVGRVLRERGIIVEHIRGDGSIETEDALMAEERQGCDAGQLVLFEDTVEDTWRSLRSVSRRGQPPPSSAH